MGEVVHRYRCELMCVFCGTSFAEVVVKYPDGDAVPSCPACERDTAIVVRARRVTDPAAGWSVNLADR